MSRLSQVYFSLGLTVIDGRKKAGRSLFMTATIGAGGENILVAGGVIGDRITKDNHPKGRKEMKMEDRD